MAAISLARLVALIAYLGCVFTALAEAQAKDDSFLLVGYVVAVSPCPRCPGPNPCKPCEEFVIVSNQRHPKDRTMTGDGNLSVLVPSAARFTMGAKVKLKVRATSNQPFQNDPCCSRLGPYVVQLVNQNETKR